MGGCRGKRCICSEPSNEMSASGDAPLGQQGLADAPLEHVNGNDTDSLDPQTTWASPITLFYSPMLVVLGVVGNLLSIFVFCRSNLRHAASTQYMLALAVVDTLFLLLMIPSWLNAMKISGLFHTQGFCQFFVYGSYVTSCSSAWLVVAFTVERLVVVMHPFRRLVLCTKNRARIFIAIVIVSAVVFNLPVLRFASPSSEDCNIDISYLEHAARFNIVDTSLSFSLPLALIIVVNISIVVVIFRKVMIDGRELRQGKLTPTHFINLRAARAQQRVTRMLLLVSSVFVLLSLPAYVLRIVVYTFDINDADLHRTCAAWQQASILFFNTNFGINFLLYCLSGANFRRALRETLTGCPPRRAPAPEPLVQRSISMASQRSGGNELVPKGSAGKKETPQLRNRAGQRVIQRWTFDNTRQTQQPAQPARPATPPMETIFKRCVIKPKVTEASFDTLRSQETTPTGAKKPIHVDTPIPGTSLAGTPQSSPGTSSGTSPDSQAPLKQRKMYPRK